MIWHWYAEELAARAATLLFASRHLHHYGGNAASKATSRFWRKAGCFARYNFRAGEKLCPNCTGMGFLPQSLPPRDQLRKQFCSGSRVGCNPAVLQQYACRYRIPQATRLPLHLRSIDHHDFSLIWPVVRNFNKAGPNRILANVVPFLCVTFVAPQNVIKESRLPQ